MGLFPRHRHNAVTGPDAVTAEATDDAPEDGSETDRPSAEPASGPYDASEAPDGVQRIDLGSLQVPAVSGMQIRLEGNPRTGRVDAAVLALGGSTLELRAFAAPRTAGIWEELREDIVAQLERSGARHQQVDGDHGTELLAQMPVRTPDGTGWTPVRFMGVDGPRWFLRGVLNGRAAAERPAAAALQEVFDGVVVVRDDLARPPREALPLHVPGDVAGPEAVDLPGLDPLRPGPTIAEVR